MKLSIQAGVDLETDTVASQRELDVFDGLVLQLAIEADLHLLELLQEPGG